MNDDQIVELYWARDENAIRETHVRYGAYCYSIANNILHNNEDSDECVNETWMKAWNAMPPQRPSRLKLFLAKITRNLSFDVFKSKMADKRGKGEIAAVLDELEECVSNSSDVEAEFQANELQQAITQFLNTFSERDYGIFLRRYFYVDSVLKIAERYALKESNVHMILCRARQRLKNHLMKEGYIS